MTKLWWYEWIRWKHVFSLGDRFCTGRTQIIIQKVFDLLTIFTCRIYRKIHSDIMWVTCFVSPFCIDQCYKVNSLCYFHIDIFILTSPSDKLFLMFSLQNVEINYIERHSRGCNSVKWPLFSVVCVDIEESVHKTSKFRE